MRLVSLIWIALWLLYAANLTVFFYKPNTGIDTLCAIPLVICIINSLYNSLYQLIKKKNIKKSISFMFPVILFVLVFLTPVLGYLKHSRHYVEFLIQKNMYIPEINEMKNGTEYKEWCIAEYTDTKYWIVFDPKSKLTNKKITRQYFKKDGYRGFYYYDYWKVAEHFYVTKEYYYEGP